MVKKGKKKKKKKGKLALSLFGRGGYSSGSDSNPFWANWANSIGGMEDSRSIYSVPEFILFLILISNFLYQFALQINYFRGTLMLTRCDTGYREYVDEPLRPTQSSNRPTILKPISPLDPIHDTHMEGGYLPCIN